MEIQIKWKEMKFVSEINRLSKEWKCKILIECFLPLFSFDLIDLLVWLLMKGFDSIWFDDYLIDVLFGTGEGKEWWKAV